MTIKHPMQPIIKAEKGYYDKGEIAFITLSASIIVGIIVTIACTWKTT